MFRELSSRQLSSPSRVVSGGTKIAAYNQPALNILRPLYPFQYSRNVPVDEKTVSVDAVTGILRFTVEIIKYVYIGVWGVWGLGSNRRPSYLTVESRPHK